MRGPLCFTASHFYALVVSLSSKPEKAHNPPSQPRRFILRQSFKTKRTAGNIVEKLCRIIYSCYRYHLLNEWKNLKWTDTDMEHIRLKLEGVHVTKFSVWMKLSSQVARSIGPWLFLIICAEFFYLDILVRTKFLLCLCCGIFAWMVHCLSSHVKRSRCEVNKIVYCYRCNRQKGHSVKQYHKNQRKTIGEKLHHYWLFRLHSRLQHISGRS